METGFVVALACEAVEQLLAGHSLLNVSVGKAGDGGCLDEIMSHLTDVRPQVLTLVCEALPSFPPLSSPC